MKEVNLDDLAAALMMLIMGQSPKQEQIGAILSDGSYQLADKMSSRKSEASGEIPGNSIALGHNHPTKESNWFSAKDVAQADAIQRTSYIGLGEDPVTAELRRYDPGFTPTFQGGDKKLRSYGEPVLAQFPWDQFKTLMMKRMGRQANDPRGLLLDPALPILEPSAINNSRNIASNK